MNNRFQGCYTATLTPYNDAGRIDVDTAGEHVQWLLEHGVQGLCPVGTTGEFLYLEQREKLELIRAAAAAAQGRAPVIAGVWALHQQERIELATFAADAGADALFLPTPIYYPADDETIYQWYRTIHAASPLPIFAYNIPQYAANSISSACLQRLLNEGIVAGIKDSSASAETLRQRLQDCSGKGTVFAASDGFAAEGRALGADGFISALANVLPDLFTRLWHGELELQPKVSHVRTVLKQVGSIAALKHLAHKQGFNMGTTRVPHTPLTQQQKALLDSLL